MPAASRKRDAVGKTLGGENYFLLKKSFSLPSSTSCSTKT